MARHQRCYRVLFAALVLCPAPAFANGRFPRAERVIEDPDDPRRLRIAGTYGILSTEDRGQSWHYICEASFSLQDSYQGDPLLDLMSDKSLLVGVQKSLNVSRDDGCQWTPVLDEDSMYVIDDSVAGSQPSAVIALIATYASGGVTYGIRQSTDGGATWAPTGNNLPLDLAYTIDVDPNDAAHLYATGLAQGAGQLVTSLDGGATWTVHAIPNTDASQAPYIAGLHPLDRDRIFVRTDSWVPIDGTLTANDALLYSGDGGETWKELLRSGAKLFGFALSPDGSTVLVGYGNPLEGAGQKVTGPVGVFKSSTEGFSFEPIFAGPVGCLAWTKNGVYVCGSQSFDGFELAFSPDADFGLEGGALSPLLLLDQIEGPLMCSSSTSGAACTSAWEVACTTFGACHGEDAGKEPSGDEREVARDAASSETDTASQVSGSTGCGCRAARRPGGQRVGLMAIAVMIYRRRKRARQNQRNVGMLLPTTRARTRRPHRRGA